MLQQARSAGRHVLARLHDRSPQVLHRLRGRLLILAYHRVLPEGERRRQVVQPGMYVQPDVFEAHVRFLCEHFRIISLTEFLLRQDAGAWRPEERYCAITFDDGWLDNYVYAYPILRRYEVAATIFVPTALIGSEEWFWQDRLGWLLMRYCRAGRTGPASARMRPLTARYPWIGRLTQAGATTQIDSAIALCKQMPDGEVSDLVAEMADRLGQECPRERRFLDWREVEEMSRAGIAFGSHAATHRLLTRLSDEEIEHEVAGSLETLRRKPVNSIPVFCYPNGDHDDRVVGQVRASGFHAALSTESGAEVWDRRDRFRLRRVGVHNDVSASTPLFAFHLSRVGRL